MALANNHNSEKVIENKKEKCLSTGENQHFRLQPIY